MTVTVWSFGLFGKLALDSDSHQQQNHCSRSDFTLVRYLRADELRNRKPLQIKLIQRDQSLLERIEGRLCAVGQV